MYRPTPNFLAALAVLLSLVAFGASAHDANVTWKNATQTTTGTALPAPPDVNALRDTRIRYGTCNAAKDAIAVATDIITVPASQTSLLVTGLPDGTFCFQAQHSTIGAAVDAVLPADGVSNWSAVVSKVFAPVLTKPKAPNTVVIN